LSSSFRDDENGGLINLKNENGKKAAAVLLEDLLNVDLSLSEDKRLPGEYSSSDFSAHQLE
jgi:hypothetical protein